MREGALTLALAGEIPRSNKGCRSRDRGIVVRALYGHYSQTSVRETLNHGPSQCACGAGDDYGALHLQPARFRPPSIVTAGVAVPVTPAPAGAAPA